MNRSQEVLNLCKEAFEPSIQADQLAQFLSKEKGKDKTTFVVSWFDSKDFSKGQIMAIVGKFDQSRKNYRGIKFGSKDIIAILKNHDIL